MAELHLDVVSRADSKGLTDAARQLKDTRAEVKGLGAETDKLGKSTDGLGDSFKGTNDDAFDFSAQLETTRAKVKALNEEFSKTGDKSLFGDLRQERSLLRQLERISKELQEADDPAVSATVGGGASGGGGGGGGGGSAFSFAGEVAKARQQIRELQSQIALTGDRSLMPQLIDARRIVAQYEKIGTEAGKAFSAGAQGTMSTPGIGPIVMASVAAAVVAASPTLGAMLAGVVAGTVGTGGVAGGLFMASRDERVRVEAMRVGDAIMAEFFRGGGNFVGPAIGALRELEDAFKDMHVPEAFAKLAPTVEVIAKGFGDFGRNIMPGLNKAFERMGPFAEVAAQGLSEAGRALGDFLDDVTASPGAIMGLETAFTVLEGVIRVTGGALKWLSDLYAGWVDTQIKLASGAAGVAAMLGQTELAARLTVLAKALVEMKDTTPGATGAIHSFGEAADVAAAEARLFAQAVKDAQDAISEFQNVMLAQDKNRLAVEQGFVDLSKVLRENRGHLFDNTQAARDNEAALQDQIGKLMVSREANIRAGMSVKDANTLYDQQIEKLIGIGANADISRTKLEAMAKKYKIEFIVTGLTNAAVSALQLAASGFTKFTKGFASGGDTPAFEPFRVHDGETLWSSRQHFVATKTETDRLARAPYPSRANGAAAGGGGTTRVVIDLVGADDDLVRRIRRTVRVEGGGDVQLAFGRN